MELLFKLLELHISVRFDVIKLMPVPPLDELVQKGFLLTLQRN